MRPGKSYAASDSFIVWAQSLSGMLTKLETEYGAITEAVERADWDEGRTAYFLALVKSLHAHIAQLDSELSIHVEEKTGEEPR